MNKIKKILPPALYLMLSGCMGDIDDQTLAGWKKLPEAARNNIVARHFGKNPEFVKTCIDRMATLPNTGHVKVMDAGNNCLLGLELRERNANPKR